jgi:predicted acetyltransferase
MPPRDPLTVRAVVPSSDYRESFLVALKSYRAANEGVYVALYSPAAADFDAYLRSMAAEEAGRDLPEGYVPCSHRWLVTPKREVVGVVRVRHRLSWMNELVGGHVGYDVPPHFRRLGYGRLCLSHGLDRAHEVGISDVLVTCSPENVASRKIIIEQGGIFEREVATDKEGPKLRFWIKTKEPLGRPGVAFQP